MDYTRPPFPTELWETNYDYPEALFEKLPADKGTAREEKVLRMAKYAVAKALPLKTSDERLIKTARGDEEGTFMTRVLKIAHGRSGVSQADVELEAQILGVSEYIWPLNPKKMEEARMVERQLQESASS